MKICLENLTKIVNEYKEIKTYIKFRNNPFKLQMQTD